MPALDARVQIGDRVISSEHDPYIIAEIGSNHDQSLDRALALMTLAAEAGASAAKFQLYRAEELVPADHPARPVLAASELPEEWLPTLQTSAARLGIDLLASCFSTRGASLLEEGGVVAHKVASSEALNLALLAQLSRSSLPVFLSIGMSSWTDVEIALEVLTSMGKSNIVILQCTSMYPLPVSRANLRVLPQLQTRYGGVVGFSDHTESLSSGAVAVGIGARVIEKHVTWSRTAEGPDHNYALEPEGFGAYCAFIHEAHTLLGSSERVVEPEERAGRRRLGLYARTAVAAGQTLTLDNVEVRGPLPELASRHLPSVVGLQVARAIAPGEALSWNDLLF